MRRLLLSLLAFVVSITMVNAGKVTEQQALMKAQQFMKGKSLRVANMKAASRGDSKEADAFFVFNVDNNGGFVIVSGDDRTEPILGYSDCGCINTSRLPDNLKWLFDYYNYIIGHLEDNPDVQVAPNKTRSALNIDKTTISPLIQTYWGQGAPYNSMCPLVNGQHCITGCAATAMAQIINYNKWPEANTSSVDAYTTVTNEISMAQLDPTSFNWNSMTNDDIARLMLYCGQSAMMDYGLEASGTTIDPIAYALTNVFGFGKTVRILNREGYDNDDNNWDNILYEELSANRPVLYRGGNHAWVIDGYQDGAFHMNWGWDGNADGYFKVSGIVEGDFMYAYKWAQCALVGISRPVNAEDNAPKVIVTEMGHSVANTTGIAYINRSGETEDFPLITISSYLISDVVGPIYIGYGLINTDGQLLKVLTSEQHTFADGEKYRYFGSVTLSKEYAVGSYRIVAICSNNGTDWQFAAQANCDYINVVILQDNLSLEIMPNWHSEADPDYQEVGEYDINGITYLLYYWHDNYLAKVLPYHKKGKYSGEIVVPAEVEFNGNTYRVFYEENAFSNCEDLTSLSIAITHPDGILYCPNLTTLRLEEGVDFCSFILGLPALESIELPATFSQTNSPQFIANCEKLKTIRFKGSQMSFREIPEWDDNSLPALTDIYFPSEVPFAVADWNENPIGDVPANSKATIHIPIGSLRLYQQSAWKQWKFVEDLPAASAVTWGYCHRDAVTNQGVGGNSSNNNLEYAMRVPAEELTVYKGSKITQIHVFSPSRSSNDYHDEDYEYVFITKPGTDYIVKQPFKVVRGIWNTVTLDIPYTISGDDIFVGIGRHGGLSVSFSDLTDQQDAVWYRAMGDDYGCIFNPGEWVRQKPNNHPLPLRFVIEGEGMPEGLVLRELELIKNESSAQTRGDGEAKMQAVVRNRSLTPVTSYTVEWTIDGIDRSSKTFETYLIPNACETITIGLPETVLSGNHIIKTDVISMNEAENELVGFNMPTLGIGEYVDLAKVTIGGAGYTTYSSQYNLDFSGFGDEVKAYIATGYDYDNGTIWLTRVKDVPAGTPLMVKGTAKETYDVPVKASSGCYYKNMLVGNLSGGTITIGGTTDGMTDYYLKNGSFLSADGTNTIGNGKAYLQIPTTPPAANVGGSQSVKLNDYGFASFCGSQDLDFTSVEGLKAFTVTGYDDANGTIWLTRVKRVSAQTPLLLKGESKGSYSVPSVAVGSYYANMMKGNLSGSTITIFTTDGDMTNYYLKGNQLLKATDGGNTIGNGKAYMQIPSKHVTRSIEDIVTNLIYGISEDEPEVISIPVVSARGINGDGTTNIREKLAPEQTNDVYYNLQGQRVENPTKGIYIKNGRKVVIK